MSEKITFDKFVKEGAGKQSMGDGMDGVRKRMNKKSHKKRNYGHAPGEPGAGSGVAPASAGGGMGESYDTLISEILAGASYGYEEDAEEIEKQDQAAAIFRALYQRKDLTREDIIGAIEQRTGVTNSTAVSYYQRIAKEMGVAGKTRDEEDDQLGGFQQTPDAPNEKVQEIPDDGELDEEPEEPEEKEGVIRTVKGAHLIKKEQAEDGKFEELWVYNVGEDMKNSLKIRRDILAGTDIGENKTKSEDGEQSYSLWTVGNAQMVHIKGLAN